MREEVTCKEAKKRGRHLGFDGNAIRLDPRHAWAYADRALAYTYLAESEQASEDAGTAIELWLSRALLERMMEGRPR